MYIHIWRSTLTMSQQCLMWWLGVDQETNHDMKQFHYHDVIMSTIASQITSLTVVYSIIYSGADQSKHQSSASLAFVWGIHRGPVNCPHKWPVTRKMFPFDDVIMLYNIHIPTRIQWVNIDISNILTLVSLLRFSSSSLWHVMYLYALIKPMKWR